MAEIQSERNIDQWVTTFSEDNSDNTPNLNEALSNARGMFDWEELRRDGTGHYGKYLTLAKIYEATSDGLSKNGLSLSHRIVDATLYASLRHASGEKIESEMPLGQPKQWQEYGKSMSYATRYAVQALLGIAGGEDLETDISGLESPVPYNQGSITGRTSERSWQQNIPDGSYDAKFNYIEKNPNMRTDKSPVATITGKLEDGKDVICSLWNNHIEVIAGLRGRTKDQLNAALENGRVVLNPSVVANVSVSAGKTRIHLPDQSDNGEVATAESNEPQQEEEQDATKDITPNKNVAEKEQAGTSNLDRAPE